MEIGACKSDCGSGISCLVKRHGEINDGRVSTMVDLGSAVPVVKSAAACLLSGALVPDLTGWVLVVTDLIYYYFFFSVVVGMAVLESDTDWSHVPGRSSGIPCWLLGICFGMKIHAGKWVYSMDWFWFVHELVGVRT